MAWVQYRIHGTPWIIGGGQFKSPLDHEQWISDARQLAADRTYVDDTLAGGEAFSKGVTLRYDDGGAFRAEAAFTDGFNNNNSSFRDFPTNAANFGVGAAQTTNSLAAGKTMSTSLPWATRLTCSWSAAGSI